mgnify:CR=1 FL=1
MLVPQPEQSAAPDSPSSHAPPPVDELHDVPQEPHTPESDVARAASASTGWRGLMST